MRGQFGVQKAAEAVPNAKRGQFGVQKAAKTVRNAKRGQFGVQKDAETVRNALQITVMNEARLWLRGGSAFMINVF